MERMIWNTSTMRRELGGKCVEGGWLLFGEGGFGLGPGFGVWACFPDVDGV